MKEFRGKKAKCLICGKEFDNLAGHIDGEYIQTGQMPFLIQHLMIQIDQMENKIKQLQS